MIQKKKSGEAVSVSQGRRSVSSSAGKSRQERSSAAVRGSRRGADRPADGKSVADVVAERFHPSAVEFLRSELGIDVAALDMGTVYDLAAGRVTRPLAVTVRPMVYDADARVSREGPELSAMVSLKVNFPHDSEFKPVDIEEGKVFVTSYPCYEYLTTDDVPSVSDGQPVSAAGDGDDRLYEFTESQKQALEGIGIDRDRFYVHSGINPLTRAQKAWILSGEEFSYSGSVRTAYGLRLNVCGTGVLKTSPDGTAKARMWSSVPVERGEGDVLDLEALSRNGNIRLDLFRRDPVSGKVLTDIDDRPVVSDAAEQLNRFGIALEPVPGYIYNKVFNKEKGVMELKGSREFFQVSVVNGGLCATRMKRVDLKDGNGRTVVRNGREAYYHELSDVRIKDGKVYILGRGLVGFPSDREENDYRCGKGIFISGMEWSDPDSDRKVKYDAYVIADNRCGGFAKVFSPEESARVREYLDRRLEQQERKRARRKAGYSSGTVR